MVDMAAAAWTACTKLLFAEKNGNPGARRLAPGFCYFAGVFEGGFGKSGLKRVVFCGEVVVICLVERGGLTVVVSALRFCHFFERFLWKTHMGVREFRGLIPKREQEIVKTPSDKKEPRPCNKI